LEEYTSRIFFSEKEGERERFAQTGNITMESPPRVGLDKTAVRVIAITDTDTKGKKKKNSTDYSITITRQEERQKREFNILSFPFFLLQIFTTLQA
jgi:hypothetical protein